MDQPGALDASDLALAESIADDLAVAFENLRLAAQVRADAAAGERDRVARELHDDTAQQLVAIGQRIELLREKQKEVSEPLEAIQAMVDETLANVRRISRDLRPSLLEELGLASAIEALVADANRGGGAHVRLRVSGRARGLDRDVELALYRVVQEALGNALRHAGASHVRVDVRFGDEVRVEISDDGRGLPSSAAGVELGRGGGMGLVGMRERVEGAGGQIRIVSQPGRGTVVRATVPVT
jgi:signal transduction histidine kinase